MCIYIEFCEAWFKVHVNPVNYITDITGNVHSLFKQLLLLCYTLWFIRLCICICIFNILCNISLFTYESKKGSERLMKILTNLHETNHPENYERVAARVPLILQLFTLSRTITGPYLQGRYNYLVMLVETSHLGCTRYIIYIWQIKKM